MSKKKRKDFIQRNLPAPAGLPTPVHPGQPSPAIAPAEWRPAEPVQPPRLPQDNPPLPLYWACAAFLVLAVLMFYLPVLNNDFVNWDDRDTILENIHIHFMNSSSFLWMFTTFHSSNWLPLTWLSFALNYRMSGPNPAAFHMTNLLLHAVNTVWVFILCLKVLALAERYPRGTGVNPGPGIPRIPAALITAILFGLHPIHVESVAWATERKDVLYAFFYLPAVYIYLEYASSPARKPLKLYSCLGLFLLSLMSKPMAVSLPFVFLVLDAWPLGRWAREWSVIFKEKLAFFALAAVGGFLSLFAHAHFISPAVNLNEIPKILNAFRSLIFYLWKMLVPADLLPMYPFPHQPDALYHLLNVLALLAVALVSWACVRYRQKAPYLGAAWLYYLVTLAPVVGVIQVGYQAAADRYTYLPSLGLFLPLAAFVAARLSNRKMALVLVCLVLTAGYGFATVRQTALWKNSQTLWESVTHVYPDDSQIAHSYLGGYFMETGRMDDALKEYQKAMTIPPIYTATHNGYASVLLYKGDINQAVEEFEAAVASDPLYRPARMNLWSIYEHKGMHEAAAQEMRAAIASDPEEPEAYSRLGVSCGFLKRLPEAEAAFRKALSLEPANPQNLVNLATVLQWEGHPDQSLFLYQNATRANPNIPVFYLKMADLYLAQGLKSQALPMLNQALGLNPVSPRVVREIGEDYQSAGQKQLAQQCFKRAHTLEGSSPK